MGMNWNPPPQVFKRIGRYADGVLPPWVPGEKAYEVRERIYEAAREAGRDPSSIGFEPRINLRTGSGEAPRTHLARPTTSSASTSGGGRSSVRSTWSSRRASAD
jgi:alkanesulfonate monooxygenase SsuD/methylene tetrahydromethanopterin reductase-like flavin-dependent oxidoreductase (luciferase family)